MHPTCPVREKVHRRLRDDPLQRYRQRVARCLSKDQLRHLARATVCDQHRLHGAKRLMCACTVPRESVGTQCGAYGGKTGLNEDPPARV